jgi:putative PEP-CTERM system TPR-repeat lipoprotein
MVKGIQSGIIASASLCIIACLLSNTAKADTTNSPATQKYLAEADDRISKNDISGAAIILKNAKKSNPNDAAIRIKLAVIELRLNDVDGAQIDLKAARQNGGDEVAIVPLLGRTYILQGKFDELLRDFPIQDNASTDVRVETLAVRANAQIGLDHLDDARSSLIAAEQLQPKAPALKFALARLDMRDNELDSALKRVDEANQIAPSAEGHYLKAQILVARNDVTGAMAEADAAIAADPNLVGALIERAQLFIAQGHDAKADADVKAALRLAPQAVTARYFEALLLVRANDYTGADTILTKYAEGYRAFPQGYLLQATVKLSLRQYEQAETAIDAYLAAVPNDARGRKFQADILMRKGDFVEAADVLQRLTDENPNDVQAFAMLGQALRPLSPDRSVEAYARAAKLAPDNPTAVRGLALDSLVAGQGAQGIADLEKLVKMTPDDDNAAESLAMAYIVAKRYGDAEPLIAGLVKKRPNDPVPADMAGLLALAQSQTELAKAAFQEVAKKFPDFIPSQLQLAKLYEVDGDRDQARAVFEAILTAHPDNLSALQGLSAILVLNNQPDRVVDLWKKSYRAKPDNVAIELGLVHAYAANKDLDGALSAVRDMQIRQPKEAQLYRVRAEVEVQKGAFKDAVESLRRENELLPANSVALRDLALVQEKAGDLPGALDTIAAARKLDPANITLAIDEVRLVGTGDPDKAVAAAQRLAALLPDEPAAQAVEGDYLFGIKRTADAIAAYQRVMQAHPSLFLVQRISGAFVVAGSPLDGEKALGDWVAAHPGDVAGRLELASFLQARKSLAAAKEQYEGLLNDLPDDPAVLNNLALIYQHDGDPRALDYARKAIAKAPDNPQIVDTLGWLLAQKDDVAGGVRLLRRAHDLSPQDLDTQYHLAYALNQTGNKDAAATLLKSALSSGADFESKGDAQALLGRLSKG